MKTRLFVIPYFRGGADWKEAEKIKNEHILESKETGPTFSIPIRPASDKS